MRPITLLVTLCVAETLSMASFANFAVLLPEFTGLWSLSNTQAGWIGGIYFAGYVLAVPVLVGLTDVVDAKRIYLVSVLIGAIASFGFAIFAEGFWTAMLFRFVSGVSLAGTYMPGLQILNDRLEEHLLALLLRWPDLRGWVNDLDPYVLGKWGNREIFTMWMGCSTNGGIIEDLLGSLEEDLQDQVNYLIALEIPPMDLRQRERAVLECSRRLEERRLRKMKVEEAALLSGDNEAYNTKVIIDGDMEKQVVDTNDRLRKLFHERASGNSSSG